MTTINKVKCQHYFKRLQEYWKESVTLQLTWDKGGFRIEQLMANGTREFPFGTKRHLPRYMYEILKTTCEAIRIERENKSHRVLCKNDNLFGSDNGDDLPDANSHRG